MNESAGGRYFTESLHTFEEERAGQVLYASLRQAVTDFPLWKGYGQLMHLTGLATPESIETKSHAFQVNYNDAWSDSESSFTGGTRADGMDHFRMRPRKLIGYDCVVRRADSYGATGYGGRSSHFFATTSGREKSAGEFVYQNSTGGQPGGDGGNGGMIGGGGRGPGPGPAR